jgi:ABC-type sugar transport system permease subunit
MQGAATLSESKTIRQRRWRRIFGNDAQLGYLFVLPLLIFVLGMLAYPFFTALYLSLTKKLLGQPAEFIGFANYIELLTQDARFRKVAVNSIVYTVAAVVAKLGIGMIMALVLNEDVKWRGFWRGLFLVPWAMPTVVTALTWRWIFDGTFGVLNYILKTLNIIQIPVPWLADPSFAMFAVIMANTWRGFPFFGISLLAGLQAIPKERYEAAEVDGATVFQRFRYITIPGLLPIIIVTTMLSTIWTFNDFALPFIITRTGPNDATNIFGTYTYQLGFVGSRLGYAISATAIMMPFLFLLILFLAPLMWKRET